MGNADGQAAAGAERLLAPAKLTLSLAVVGRRADGFHDLSAEMVSIDLADELELDPGADGLEIVAGPGTRAEDLGSGPDNLVNRALVAVRRHAGVHLVKRIPVAGGLGGGSADAAAVLRWGQCSDPSVAAALGADVPFCVVGGRARVGGVGERVTPLPYVARSFVLLVPPFGVDTGAVFDAFDRGAGPSPGGNELTAAALATEPRLAAWRDLFAAATGCEPRLAGSGSTWFVEGERVTVGLEHRRALVLGSEEAPLLSVRTVPAGWAGPAA